MRNLLGNGKLDGLREMEGGLIAAGGRASGGRAPLDYTIVKFGDVERRYDEGGGRDDAIGGYRLGRGRRSTAASDRWPRRASYSRPWPTSRTRGTRRCAPRGRRVPGDRPAARDPQQTWNDKFLCLSGPELLRIEAGSDVDYAELGQYVKLWSGTHDHGGGGGRGTRGRTGLTTPAIVRASAQASVEDRRRDREEAEDTLPDHEHRRQVQVGTEERADERMRNASGGKPSSLRPPTRRRVRSLGA
ncbi:hypothetical protein ACHAW5_008768 [Stephanodiscus triporus]|uniref:Uncharacterized protein n=1 Tax=Stephanodiscus triporus TaxID=2934178 RepID=A0ABD3P726_9STRA